MPGYTSIPTEAYTTDIVEVIWSGAYTQDITQVLFGVILTLVALVCLIGGCTTFYESKEIFLTTFFANHAIFLYISMHTSYVCLKVSECLLFIAKWVIFQLFHG